MKKRLYIDEDRLGFLRKSAEQTGEHQGGSYVARVQTGTEKDGSPQYRYFRSQADYNDYLSRARDAKQKGAGKTQGGKKGNKPSGKERLKSKLKEEQESSSKKTRSNQSNKVTSKDKDSGKKKRSLLSGDKTAKSMRIYLGDTDVE
jgi:hypothetical protein